MTSSRSAGSSRKDLVEVGRSSRRVLGWAQGGCGAGRTVGGSTFRSRWFAGAQRRGSREGVPRQKSAWVRPIRYLGEYDGEYLVNIDRRRTTA